MAVQLLRKKFTVGQYHQMVETGILTDRDRVELLQGEIIEMSPVGRQHAACVDRLNELLVLGLSTRAIVRVQSPIRLGNSSEPQPDVAILRRRPDFYAEAHPQAEDVLALVEVSDTTVEFDRTVKVPLYAQDGIAEVWIVDLKAGAVEVYREPKGDGYQQVQMFRRGDVIGFQAFIDTQFTVPVDQILG
jgi:Uma2 family endonuclease